MPWMMRRSVFAAAPSIHHHPHQPSLSSQPLGSPGTCVGVSKEPGENQAHLCCVSGMVMEEGEDRDASSTTTQRRARRKGRMRTEAHRHQANRQQASSQHVLLHPPLSL
jgi:hypothetical protein